MEISPKEFGLSSRIKLAQVNEHHIAIIKNIKSRIIKKDALKLIDIAQKIRTHKSSYKISLMCNRNICSKSIQILDKHNIEIIYID